MESSQWTAKLKAYIDLVTILLVMGAAGWWARGWFKFVQYVLDLLLPGPSYEMFSLPIAIWLVVMTVVLILGVVGIHFGKYVAFHILCRVAFLVSVWIVVWSVAAGCSGLMMEVHRFNFHQSQWTVAYERQREGQSPNREYVDGYPSLLDQMWENYRRARGLPGPAPPRRLEGSAQLDASQLQKLAAKIDTLMAIAGKDNVPLRCFVTIELGGGETQPPEEVKERVQEILLEVDKEFYLRNR